MGQFKIEIVAVGGHGCQREKKDGEEVRGCGYPTCPDCNARAFVEDFAKRNNVESASLTHWPGTPSEVVDNLRPPFQRKGSF